MDAAREAASEDGEPMHHVQKRKRELERKNDLKIMVKNLGFVLLLLLSLSPVRSSCKQLGLELHL